MNANVFLLQLWNGVFTIRSFGLHGSNIGIFPMYNSPGTRTARLQAGSAMKNNHHVLAASLGLRFLSFFKPFASRHHQHNRDDSPGNTKHRKKCAQLMRPHGAQHIADEIPNDHFAARLIGRGPRQNVSRAGYSIGDTERKKNLLQENEMRDRRKLTEDKLMVVILRGLQSAKDLCIFSAPSFLALFARSSCSLRLDL